MTYMVLLAAYAACVLTVIVAIFVRRRWLRSLAVVAGAVALWLPLLTHIETLGAPSPFPPEGDYRLISSKMDDTEDILYLFVDTLGQDFTPRVYRIPFDRSRYKRLAEQSDYLVRVLRISGGRGGDFEVVYVDYTPPDLLKGNMMRGWRNPRPED